MRSCFGGAPANAGIGACVNGTQECLADGEFGAAFGPCTGYAMPSSELCNGIDDDCDGATDDGISCGCDATTEVCGNAIDDDCDGAVDEGCGAGCGPQPVHWDLPSGTIGGPECIRLGGGTCVGTTEDCPDASVCLTRDRTCPGPGHYGTLRCNDGSYVRTCYCDVITMCTAGALVVTGFTW